jgi:ABC-2 type transport system permease protein
MAATISARGLGMTFRAPVREAGVRAAFRALFRPCYREVRAVQDVSFDIEPGEVVFQQFITPLLGLAVWTAALPGNTRVSAYYVALLFVQLMTVCYEGNTFANQLTSGGLGNQMLRPNPVILSVAGENLAWRIWHVLFGTPAVIAIALLAGVTLAPGPLLLAAPAVAIAAVLRFVFTYAIVLTALWTQQSGSVLRFANTLIFLLGGIAAPVTLFPDRYRWLGEVLPFRGLAGFPAEIAAGTLSGQQVAAGYVWQLLWSVLVTAVAVVAWRAGVRKYTAVGA